MTILSPFSAGESFHASASNTSFTAHIGGIVTGLTFGTCIIRNFNVQNWENIVKYISWLVFIIFGGTLFFCQFATFEVGYTDVVVGYMDAVVNTDIRIPILSAGGSGGGPILGPFPMFPPLCWAVGAHLPHICPGSRLPSLCWTPGNGQAHAC